MSVARVGSLLLGLGLTVGCATVIGVMVGFEPANLPRAVLNIAAYKLTFLAAAGLLGAGAILIRYARKERTRGAASLADTAPPQLDHGQVITPADFTRHASQSKSELPRE